MNGERAFVPVAFSGTAALAAAAVIVSALPGLLAFGFGALGTSLFLGGTWLIVRLVSPVGHSAPPSRLQVVLAVVALLLKLPLVYAGWLLAQRLGPFGPTWFLAGLALVYCLVIWRAVLAVRD